MKNKKAKLAFVTFATTVFFVGITMLSNFKFSAYSKTSGQENITTTLNSSHAPTESSSFVDTVEKEYPSLYSTFVYKKVKAASNKLCELDVGGTIEKVEASKQLTSINITYSGARLVVYTKYNNDLNYTTYITVNSGVTTSIGGNYFKIYSTTGSVITSIILNYNCENAAATNLAGYSYMKSNDGGSSYAGFAYGATSVGAASINKAGTYRIEAENTDQDLVTIKSGQSAKYDSTQYASGGKSMKPGKYSRLVFPFLLNKSATVNLLCAIAFLNAYYLDNTENRNPGLAIWCFLDGQVLDQPHTQLGNDGKPTPEGYYVWRNVDYGTFELEKGYHSFMIQFFSNDGPNVDYLDIVVTNYNIEHAYSERITSNTTTYFYADKILGHGGPGILNDTWITTNPYRNGCQENVTWESVARHSFAGYLNGSEFDLEFNLLGECDVTLCGYFASQQSITLNGANTFCTIDGTNQTVTGSVTLGDGWYSYQTLTFNTYHLSGGNHRIKIALLQVANSIGFYLTTSNMDISFVQISNNGTYTLEAEDSRIDRSGWKIRQDFIDAHREPIESWSNSGASPATSATSGTSLCGLVDGCQITLPITVNDSCALTFQVICAYTGSDYAHNKLSTTVDGTTLTDPDTTVVLTEGPTSQYWYWKVFKAGSISLSAGTHTIVLTLVNSAINIDGFRFVITNYGS